MPAQRTRSIWITQLAFDADCVAHEVDAGGAPSVVATTLLLDALLHASSARGVAVRILLNETILLDTATALRRALRRVEASDVRVRGVSRFPCLLHAKMVIVDEREALILGSPFVNGYWDHPGHPPSDARRGARELGGRPLHDVSMHLAGSVVRSLAATFAELWNDASIGDVDDAPIECRPATSVDGATIGVTRTASRRVLPRHPDGLTEIVASIQGALAAARRFVYIEHQYLSSRRVLTALAAALTRAPSLEVTIVLNQNPDVTAYLPVALGLQLADRALEIILNKPGVGADRLQRARDDPFRLVPPRPPQRRVALHPTQDDRRPSNACSRTFCDRTHYPPAPEPPG